MSEEELPELDISVISIVLHRETGEVEVNYEGMNYLEAIGVLTVALNQVQEDPLFADWSDDDDED